MIWWCGECLMCECFMQSPRKASDLFSEPWKWKLKTSLVLSFHQQRQKLTQRSLPVYRRILRMALSHHRAGPPWPLYKLPASFLTVNLNCEMQFMSNSNISQGIVYVLIINRLWENVCKYLVGALSGDTIGTLVTKSGAQAYRSRGERDHFRGYYGALLEGKYRCGTTRRASGPEWGKWGQATVLEEVSQGAEIPHEIHYPSLTGARDLHTIVTCIKDIA